MHDSPAPVHVTSALAARGLGWGALVGALTAAVAIAFGVAGDSAGSGSAGELLALIVFYGSALGAPIGAVAGLIAGTMVGMLHTGLRDRMEPQEARATAVTVTSVVLAVPLLMLASVGGPYVLALLVVPIAAWRMNRTLRSLTAPQTTLD